MFRKIVLASNIIKVLKTTTRNHQVTVLGGTTEIGQAICLLLRRQPNITKLIIHDTQKETRGVTLDLSHVPSNTTVKSYVGEDTLKDALNNSEIVIAAGGLIRKPGITDNLWFASNTVFVKTLAKAVARLSPMPFLGIVTEPINSLIPMTIEVLRYYGGIDTRKVFGITNIDALRAQTLYAQMYNLDPTIVDVPVIGGHSAKTCIPLLSQAYPPKTINEEEAQEFTEKLRKTETDVIKEKKGVSPVLSTAYSALLFTRSVLNVLDGKKGTVHAFVENNDFGTGFFSGLVHLTEDGIKEMQTYHTLSSYECELLERSIKELRKDVMKGQTVLENVG